MYIMVKGKPEFGEFSETKYSSVKEHYSNGSFTVMNLDTDDSAVYFCAVGRHSETEHLHHCTKTPARILLQYFFIQTEGLIIYINIYIMVSSK